METNFPTLRALLDELDKEVYNKHISKRSTKCGLTCIRLVLAMIQDGIDIDEIIFWGNRCNKHFNFVDNVREIKR